MVGTHGSKPSFAHGMPHGVHVLLGPQRRRTYVFGAFKARLVKIISGKGQIMGTGFSKDWPALVVCFTDCLHGFLSAYVNHEKGAVSGLGQCDCTAGCLFLRNGRPRMIVVDRGCFSLA